MTLLEPRDRLLTGATVPVRVVDTDVHPVPKMGEYTEFIPEPYRSQYFARRKTGDSITYDAPDYAHAMAMRMDSFPDDGNFAGSDPDLAFQHVIMEAGCDLVVLEPGARSHMIPEVSQASAIATNHWLEHAWLSSGPNWHGRWRGAICVAIEDPQGAVDEINYWGEHEMMSKVLIHAEPRPSWGHPMYDPVWEAAVRHDLPVVCHLGRGTFEKMPRPPVGIPSYNHDFMVTYSLLALNQVTSLIFDGVFERHPDLQVVLVEHAFSWILPLMWRMDNIYEARKGDVPHLRRKPSEYVYDHLWFTTQPLDYPEDKLELTRALEMMQADKLLLFSSDYPHWTYDDPQWIVKHIPEQMRDAIMFKNSLGVYKNVPATVPALDGQKRITW